MVYLGEGLPQALLTGYQIGLDKRKLEESQRQFDESMAFKRRSLAESTRQFDVDMGYKRDVLEFDKDKFRFEQKKYNEVGKALAEAQTRAQNESARSTAVETDAKVAQYINQTLYDAERGGFTPLDEVVHQPERLLELANLAAAFADNGKTKKVPFTGIETVTGADGTKLYRFKELDEKTGEYKWADRDGDGQPDLMPPEEVARMLAPTYDSLVQAAARGGLSNQRSKNVQVTTGAPLDAATTGDRTLGTVTQTVTPQRFGADVQTAATEAGALQKGLEDLDAERTRLLGEIEQRQKLLQTPGVGDYGPTANALAGELTQLTQQLQTLDAQRPELEKAAAGRVQTVEAAKAGAAQAQQAQVAALQRAERRRQLGMQFQNLVDVAGFKPTESYNIMTTGDTSVGPQEALAKQLKALGTGHSGKGGDDLLGRMDKTLKRIVDATPIVGVDPKDTLAKDNFERQLREAILREAPMFKDILAGPNQLEANSYLTQLANTAAQLHASLPPEVRKTSRPSLLAAQALLSTNLRADVAGAAAGKLKALATNLNGDQVLKILALAAKRRAERGETNDDPDALVYEAQQMLVKQP